MESVTCTVKLATPAAVGIPEMTPPGARLSSGGSEPDATDQEYGGVPPFAASVVE
jgi:hypothetical protein